MRRSIIICKDDEGERIEEKGVIRMLGKTRIRELQKLKKKTFYKAMLQDMRLVISCITHRLTQATTLSNNFEQHHLMKSNS